jgi:hypothetical protein
MVRAHSLLYAIYICLIVSIICGALLYFANLYGQLNLYYNLQEELYLQNQSVVNYALGNKLAQEEFPVNENSGIEGKYIVKPYGLLTLLMANTALRKDTVAAAFFVGSYTKQKTAIHLANFSKGLSYSGQVKLIGDSFLPSLNIETSYINNKPNSLTNKGKITISEIILPRINSNFKNIFEGINAQKATLNEIEKPKDSLYYNSFFNQTKEVYVPSVLNNMIFKGNFVLRSKDSIRVKKNSVLEDVILIAPKITFEEGFSGNVQAFALIGIELGSKVMLHYPSVLCVYNTSNEQSFITIKKECKIDGAVVLFGNQLENIDKNTITFQKDGLLLGDLYCTGKLDLKSKVYGSVYTNRFFLKTEVASYDNVIEDIEVNTEKIPSYFISIPLFDNQKEQYGIIKKVL